MNIKEIVLEAGHSTVPAYWLSDEKPIACSTSNFERLVSFAEALIAEIAKQNEPVARVNGYYSGHPVIMPLVKYVFPVGLALYTFPPKAEQIVNETAEVIAEYCRKQDHYCLATEIESGAWKEFKK